jgi:hypothetical protein
VGVAALLHQLLHQAAAAEVRGHGLLTGATQLTTHKSQPSTGHYATLKPACRLVDNVTGKTSLVVSETSASEQAKTLLPLLTFLVSATLKKVCKLFVDPAGQWLVDLRTVKKVLNLKL